MASRNLIGGWLGDIVGEFQALSSTGPQPNGPDSNVPRVGVVRADERGLLQSEWDSATRVYEHTLNKLYGSLQGLPPPENAFWRRPDVAEKVIHVVSTLEAERTSFGACVCNVTSTNSVAHIEQGVDVPQLSGWTISPRAPSIDFPCSAARAPSCMVSYVCLSLRTRL